MTPERRALELITLVYDSVVEPKSWSAFAKALSDLFGGAAVAVDVHVLGEPASAHLCGLDPESMIVARRHLSEGLPFIADVGEEIAQRFVDMSDYTPNGQVPSEGFARDFLAPQGLALEPPILHVTSPEEVVFSTHIAVYRREGGPEIDDDMLAVADLVVPHMRRAISLRERIGGTQQTQVALSEVIDRIPTGVILVDTRRQIVLTNRMADRIITSRDGLEIGKDGPRGIDRDTTRSLHRLIDSAVKPLPGLEMAGGGFMALQRPSGLHPFPVLVTPILGRSENSTIADAAAVIFVSDPELRDVSITNVLTDLYGLTPAEAELAQLLAQGNSLEEAANARGVTLNTARSQLKQVFAKTDTNRQGELLQLMLSGVAVIRQEPDEEPS